MSLATPEVKLSQDTLFFPLPLESPVENVLKLTNATRPLDSNGNPSTNPNDALQCVAFRVMSSVRNRYSVRPSMGFLSLPVSVLDGSTSSATGNSSIITFLLDPQQITRSRSTKSGMPEALPDVNTHDTLIVDFAAVDDLFLIQKEIRAFRKQNGVSASDTAHRLPSTAITQAAAAFWKNHGKLDIKIPKEATAAGADATTTDLVDNSGGRRMLLHCRYMNKGSVPDNMVMRMTTSNPREIHEQSSQRPSVVAPEPPTSRASTTNRKITSKDPPPVIPPPSVVKRASVTPSTPRAGTAPAMPAKAAEVPAAKPSPQEAPSKPAQAAAATTAGINRAGSAVANAPAVATGSAKKDGAIVDPSAPPKSFLKEYLFFRIPLPIVIGLVVLSILCSLFEKDSFLLNIILGS